MRPANLLRPLSIAGALALLRLIPLDAIESVSLCPIYHLTGRRCPGCGMTRAFANLLRGNWERALDYNPLSPLLFVLILVLFIDELISLISIFQKKVRPTLIERLFGLQPR